MATKRQRIELTPGQAIITCRVCGFDWETPARGGRYSDWCPECRPPERDRANGRARLARRGRGGFVVITPQARPDADPLRVEAYLKLLDHVNLRVAVEEAVPLLRLGRYRQALVVLERIPARRRRAS